MTSPARPTWPLASFIRLVETLLVGAAGGALFTWLGLPAGWLSGSMIAVAVAALATRPVYVPPRLAQVVFVAVGTSLGAAVTPETLRGIGLWPLSVALLAAGITLATLSSALYLRKVHGWDTLSALLGSTPGALSQVIAYANQYKSDLRGIAIVQTIRVVILTACLPLALAVLGFVDPAAATIRRADAPLYELAILVAFCAAVAVGLQKLRFPGGLIFGSMMASAALHGSGLIHAVLPWWVVVAAMVSLGAITGSRFANTDIRLLLKHLAAAFGSFATAIAVVAMFVWISASLLSLKVPELLVSYAPGALDAMMIVALALHLDPVFVGAHHVARFLLVSLALPAFVRMSGARDDADTAIPPPSPPASAAD
jgi:membrane AbrB-like protein